MYIMAHALSDQAPSQLFSFLKETASKFLTIIKAKRSARKAYNQLNNLSDRELRDIGLTRGDIRAAAEGKVDKELKRNIPELVSLNPNLRGWS